MIDLSVSLMGLADSFNLLLWIVIFLGKYQGTRNRILTLGGSIGVRILHAQQRNFAVGISQ